VTEVWPDFVSSCLQRGYPYRKRPWRQRGKRKKNAPTVGLITPLPRANSSVAPPGTWDRVVGPSVLAVAPFTPPTLSTNEHPCDGVTDDEVSDICSSMVETVGPSEVSSGTVVDGPRRLSPVVVADASLQLSPIIRADDLGDGGGTYTLVEETAASQPAGQPKCVDQSVVDEVFVPLSCATSAQGDATRVPSSPNPCEFQSSEFKGPWAPHEVPVHLDVGNLADIQDDWIRVNHVSSRDMKFGLDTETMFQVSASNVPQTFRPPTKRDVRLNKSLKSLGWEDALDRWRTSAPPPPTSPGNSRAHCMADRSF
jgi:hypothetical protein